MADEGLPTVQCSQFPTPPPFFKHFTTLNLERLESIKKQAEQSQSGDGTDQKELDLSNEDVPEDLQALIPPRIPESGEFESFGEAQDLSNTLPSLSDWGVEQLYTSLRTGSDAIPTDCVPQFIRLVRSVLLNFLELTKVLSANPEQAADKIEDLRVLLLNAHQLLNEYRPHQGRETLLQRMEERVKTLHKRIQDAEADKARVNELLTSLGGLDESLAGMDAGMLNADHDRHEKQLQHARRTWSALNGIELG